MSLADQNNNPGNLKPGVGKIIWAGQTGTDSNGFAIFDSKDAGIRAADLNLQAYSKHGYDTITSIISHWSTTDQQSYITNVSNGLGVSPNQALDLTNPTVRQGLLAQIFKQEGGNYTPSQGALSSMWGAIQNAVSSGNPIEVPSAALGATNDNSTNTLLGAIGNALLGLGIETSSPGSPLAYPYLSSAGSGFLSSAKSYLIPVAIGFGAIFLIFFSSWGLIKDTPAGSTIKTGAKTAAALAFV